MAVVSTGVNWLKRVKMMKVELHPKFNESATYDSCAGILSTLAFSCSREDRALNGPSDANCEPSK